MNPKSLALAATLAALFAGGAYYLGLQKGMEAAPAPVAASPQTAAAPQAAPAVAPAAAPAAAPNRPGPITPGAQVPSNHPIHPEYLAKLQGGQAVAPAAAPAAPPTNPNAKFTHFRVGNRNVKDMMVDGSHVWVGTSGGVIRYDTDKGDYRLFDVQAGNLLANGVFHIGRLDADHIAVGTYGGGLSVHDLKADKWENYNVPNGLADAFVYDTVRLPNGDVWIATWSGANRVRGGEFQDPSKWDTFTVENTKGGLPNDWVYGLAEGKNGEVWLGTEGGLARFKDGQWEHWTHEQGVGASYEAVKGQNELATDPGLTSSHHARQKQEQGLGHVTTAYNPNYIISMQVAPDGTVWCGTWGAGLAHFDGQKWINYTMKEGLPSNHVFMLHVDGQGRLWAGTNNGLARKDGDKFTVMTTADGLFSNNVFSMSFDGEGTLWVGSYGGVARIAQGEGS